MKVGISGIGGRIGSQYAKLLAPHTEVWGFDINSKSLKKLTNEPIKYCESNEDLARKVDYFLLAVPMTETEEVAITASKHIRKDGAIGGFTSVKWVEDWPLVENNLNNHEIGTFHPLHSNTVSPKNRTVLAIPIYIPVEHSLFDELSSIIKDKIEANLIRFEAGKYPLPKIPSSFHAAFGSAVNDKKLNGVSSSTNKSNLLKVADEHDMLMAVYQGLEHVRNETTALTWKRLGINPKYHHIYRNNIDRAKYSLALRLLAQNLQVYSEIPTFNPHIPYVVNLYTEISVERFRMALKGDEEGLFNRDESVRVEYLKEDRIREHSKLFDEVVGSGYSYRDQKNSQLSLRAMAETLQRLDVSHENDIFETTMYNLGQLLMYKVFEKGTKVYIRNSIRNPETKIHDFEFCNSLQIINQIDQTGDYARLYTFLEDIANYYSKRSRIYELKRTNKFAEKFVTKTNNGIKLLSVV